MRATSSEPTAGTKFRIIETATRLFAERGFDAVPLRDVAIEADVNGAAVNYHFGSKEELIREVYRRIFTSLNELRLRALDHAEVAAKGKHLAVSDIVRALVGPIVRFSHSEKNGGIYWVRLMFHAYGLQRGFVDQGIAQQVDHIAVRFVDALQGALPKVRREDLFWRFDFAIGSCQHILLDPRRDHRLKRLSDGECDTDDEERICEELIASIAASFGAPSLSKTGTPRRPRQKK
jgi:AcrR family transcriptional regulator